MDLFINPVKFNLCEFGWVSVSALRLQRLHLMQMSLKDIEMPYG
jgi:hypothetical protein